MLLLRAAFCYALHMKLTVFFICLFLVPFSAFAGGDEDAVPCVLENKEFCGKFRDNQGFEAVFTGDRLTYDGSIPCTVMKEGRFEDGRPYSLVKCTSTRFTPDYPYYLKGYLFTYFLKQDWNKIKKNTRNSVHMYTYSKPGIKEIACFSDKKEERDMCDIQEVVDKHIGSRIPFCCAGVN